MLVSLKNSLSWLIPRVGCNPHLPLNLQNILHQGKNQINQYYSSPDFSREQSEKPFAAYV